MPLYIRADELSNQVFKVHGESAIGQLKKSIELPKDCEVSAVRENWKEKLSSIKSSSKTDIYLCGGSEFAGFVLEAGMIDEVILKVNPFCLGEGKPLFASSQKVNLELLATESFAGGVIESRYRVI